MASRLPALCKKSLFIDNEFRDATGRGTIEVVDAATEEVIATLTPASAVDLDQAVDSARRAFDGDGWSGIGGTARAAVLRRIAAGVKARAADLARIESHMGKPVQESVWDLGDVSAVFEYYADLAEKLDTRQGQPVAVPDEMYKCAMRFEPVGVAAAIVPWNYPLLMAAWKIAPALAAGCCMVLKPSELTPLTVLELAAIASEAGLPAGVLNIIVGAGDIGALLAAHPRCDKVAFTGSEASGISVMSSAAKQLKNVSLELGGKSPILVFDDVELDKAVEWVMFGVFWTNGQICSSTSRLLIDEAIAPKFLARLCEAAASIPIIDPLAPDSADATGVLGPLVSRAQHGKVSRLVREAVSDGAQLLLGGGRPAAKPRGYYFEPTVLRVEPTRHEIWSTEAFGPVLSVATFRTEAEAVRLANDSSFGLGAAVLSRDQARCDRVSKALQAGIVWVNCSQPAFCQAPWGGFKRSGIGRECGEHGLESYLEPKQVTTFVDKGPLGWYKMPPSKL